MAGEWDWSRYAVGGATRPDSFSGMDQRFNSALQQLFAAAPADLNLQVGSGFRSIERQRQLWEASDKSGRMVARPGGSKHNHGLAADLSAAGARLDKANPAARQWVHDNASKYGLTFPMSWEPWHIELVGARGGKAGQPAAAPAAAQPGPTIAAAAAMNAGASRSALGDVVAPNAPAFTPPPSDLGSIALSMLQTSQAQSQQRAEREAADQERRRALLDTSGLYGLYA
jgi:hypothetical protein